MSVAMDQEVDALAQVDNKPIIDEDLQIILDLEESHDFG